MDIEQQIKPRGRFEYFEQGMRSCVLPPGPDPLPLRSPKDFQGGRSLAASPTETCSLL